MVHDVRRPGALLEPLRATVIAVSVSDGGRLLQTPYMCRPA